MSGHFRSTGQCNSIKSKAGCKRLQPTPLALMKASGRKSNCHCFTETCKNCVGIPPQVAFVRRSCLLKTEIYACGFDNMSAVWSATGDFIAFNDGCQDTSEISFLIMPRVNNKCSDAPGQPCVIVVNWTSSTEAPETVIHPSCNYKVSPGFCSIKWSSPGTCQLRKTWVSKDPKSRYIDRSTSNIIVTSTFTGNACR